MFLKIKNTYLSILLLSILLGCQQSKPDVGQEALTESASPIRAWVDKTAVTQDQLDYALQRITDGAIVPLDNRVYEKVLDSVISSRAMSILAEKDMSEKDRQYLELQVQAYREELLTKYYINRHADPEPITSEMVEQYYLDHPEEFGGKQIKSFEYLISVGPLDDDVRKSLLQKFQRLSLDLKVDLEKAADKLKKEGFAVKYKTAEMSVDLVQDPIKKILEKTSVNQFSSNFDHAGQMVLLRVNSSKTIEAKSLSEVAADIRQKLAPLQLKKSIKHLIENAKNKVEIRYEGISAE